MRNHALLLAGLSVLNLSLAAASPAVVQGTGAASAAPQTARPAPAPEKPAEKKEIKVSETALKTYVGEYEMTNNRVLTVTLENGYLWGQPTDQQKRQLFAESQTRFFLKDLEVQVTFQKDAKGNVTGMIMDQAGRPQRELKKIK